MADPFIGEIRIFAGNFAPQSWQFCDGRLLPIFENDALFYLIGTTYGGDGENTFALPDLRGRIPLHRGRAGSGSTYQFGQQGGTETVALVASQMPRHTHGVLVSTSPGQLASPTGAYIGADRDFPAFAAAPQPATMMAADAVGNSGSTNAHENMPPFVGLSFIICLYGIFPSQG